MKRTIVFLATVILAVAAAARPALATAPDVKTIVKAMKRGLQGPDNAVRTMNLKVISNGSVATEWKVVQANGDANGARWILTVVLEPPGARRMAFLDKEQTEGTSTVKYAYLAAFVTGQECAGVSATAQVRLHRGYPNPRRAAPSIRHGLGFGYAHPSRAYEPDRKP